MKVLNSRAPTGETISDNMLHDSLMTKWLLNMNDSVPLAVVYSEAPFMILITFGLHKNMKPKWPR